jgi:hypothetical protein
MNEPTETTANDIFSRRYELKFTIQPSLANEIREWAKAHMAPDDHLVSGIDSYRITSLYLDTPELGIFHRESKTKGRKFRLRRYGQSASIWLEIKRKKGDLVRKRRSQVAEHELATVHQPHSTTVPPIDPECAWFQDRIDRYKLQPSTWVQYDRFAWVGREQDHHTRLTIDKDIRCLTAKDWLVPSELGGLAAELTSSQQLELKFCDTMPLLFKNLMTEFSLTRSVLSKYRTSVSICYLVLPESLAS